MLIVSNYLLIGNQERLFEEFAEWTQEVTFDYEMAGARMLGFDLASLLDNIGIERISGVLSTQSDVQKPGRLPAEMSSTDPDRARALVGAMLEGVLLGRRE